MPLTKQRRGQSLVLDAPVLYHTHRVCQGFRGVFFRWFFAGDSGAAITSINTGVRVGAHLIVSVRDYPGGVDGRLLKVAGFWETYVQ